MSELHRVSKGNRALELLPWLAGLPFVLSLLVHVVGATPSPSRPADIRPALAFEQYMVNLGPVPPRRFVHARFAFRNAGTEPVHITDLEPSCGCLNPRLEKRDFEPGESGKFYLRVETPGEQPGEKEYWVKVRYTDPEPRTAHLVFRVTLPERQVVVQPKGLIFYQFGAGETTQEILVTDYRAEPLTLISAESSSELVTVGVSDAETDEDGNRLYRVRVTAAGDVPPGRNRVLVTMKTNDSIYPELQVPLIVQGVETPEASTGPIQILPRLVTFLQPGTEPVTKEVTIVDTRESPLTPTAVQTSSGFVSAELGEIEKDHEGRRKFRVKITVAADVPAGKTRDTVHVVTDDADHRKLEIPLVIQGPEVPDAAAGDDGPASTR